ncbi:MAG: glycosyltransferase family 4 protein [Bacteroidia bacterium]|nr:glycosyltransferase family 4 protein [Bacteroidia bacterium]HMU77741.1 glycosyltransferase family 4 protein [Bacteroidia bacterium]HMW10649.1 glycosyltransferase family 4 protein [Bacteroidia bacterium]HMX97243.1 glycosyltransferase family 4 protein [Bacteroidia bacterium]HMY14266.1 glycosyltransferase family 4 protein [Bacteroidia bacterium]
MAVKTLQLFESYLPNAQNWFFRMLNNLPDTEVNVAAYRYYNEQFVTQKINLLPMPEYVSPELLEGRDQAKNIFSKIINRISILRKNKYYFDYIGKWARENGIEIIHTHFANMGWQYLELKKITGLPYFVSFYGFDYESLPFRFQEWKKRYQSLYEQADGFVCEGAFGASILINQGCDPAKVHIVHLGVETSKIPAVARTKNEGELHLLQLSNYSQKKGHIYSLQAFIQALNDCPNMTLTFVGNELENIKGNLEALVKQHNIEHKVRFIGFIEFTKLYEFFGKYHVFIHPSCYSDTRDCEGGAPIVLLDAQCTGMPVISTTHCDIPEEVIHGKTGLLTPEKDADALSGSIRTFYNMNNNTYQQFATAARQHVIENFDIKPCALQLQQLYNTIVNH